MLRFESKATRTRRDKGLGGFNRTPLRAARDPAEIMRAQLTLGTDPLERRRRTEHEERQAKAAGAAEDARATAT